MVTKSSQDAPSDYVRRAVRDAGRALEHQPGETRTMEDAGAIVVFLVGTAVAITLKMTGGSDDAGMSLTNAMIVDLENRVKRAAGNPGKDK